MIRFIDLSKEYWTDPKAGFPLCAFLNTTDNRFLQTEDFGHVFRKEDVEEHQQSKRMMSLIPPGFWEAK